MALLLVLAGSAQAAPPRAPSDAPPAGEWRWQQVLSSPRIGGRLTALAVDPADAARIYVGTEEGTVVVSTDGGLTWDERALTPSIISARSVGLRALAPPDPGSADSARLRLGLDPPDRFFADDLPVLFDTVAFGTFLPFMGTGFPPYILGAAPELSLLSDVVESRRGETNPVVRIAACPGAEFPLLIATERELYGSQDGAVRSLRLFFVDPRHTIAHVACSPWDPREIALSTSMGLFRSKNGGVSFEATLTGRPGPGSTASAYARAPGQARRLFHAADGELYGGDPDQEVGLAFLYPEEDPSTAPWEEIRWIEPTTTGGLWLATEDGVRRSLDGGEHFANVAPALFGGREILQVLEGRADGEGARVGVLAKDGLWASDDGGRSFYPFFTGATRRSLRQAAVGPSKSGVARWWVVSSGELWTTVPPRSGAGTRQLDQETRRWAEVRLRRTPPLEHCLEVVLAHLALSPERLDALAFAERSRAYVPYLDARLSWLDDSRARQEAQDVPLQENREERRAETLVFQVQATWELADFFAETPRSGQVMPALYELRRQVSFTAEDAWHERWSLLARLAAGMSDGAQIEALRARIEGLEALLGTWGWSGAGPEGE